MITLGIGIVAIRSAHAHNFFHHGTIGKRRAAQLGPIPSFAASDYVVNRSQCELFMIQVSMQHISLISV